jgi:hypothetical protein
VIAVDATSKTTVMGAHDLGAAKLAVELLPKPVYAAILIERPSEIAAQQTCIEKDQPPAIEQDRMFVTRSASLRLVDRLL